MRTDLPPNFFTWAAQLLSLMVHSRAAEPPSRYTTGTLGGFALRAATTCCACFQSSPPPRDEAQFWVVVACARPMWCHCTPTNTATTNRAATKGTVATRSIKERRLTGCSLPFHTA